MLCRVGQSREYDGWRRSLERVRLIFLWDRLVVDAHLVDERLRILNLEERPEDTAEGVCRAV